MWAEAAVTQIPQLFLFHVAYDSNVGGVAAARVLMTNSLLFAFSLGLSLSLLEGLFNLNGQVTTTTTAAAAVLADRRLS